jgi:hypothetical protein
MKKEAWAGGICSTHGIIEKYIQNFRRTTYGTDHLGVLGVDHIIILKLIIWKKKYEVAEWIQVAHYGY